MITKAQIATLLGIADASIDTNIFTWAVSQFCLLTGLKSAETTKHYRRNFNRATSMIQIGDKNIKEVSSFTLDGVVLDYTNFVDYTLNPDTGNIVMTAGVVGYLDIEYKVNAFTDDSIYSFLVALLTMKGITIFAPQNINSLQSVSIGRFSKVISHENPIDGLDIEIEKIVELIKSEGSGASYGEIA
jgi:hypothetical protein